MAHRCLQEFGNGLYGSSMLVPRRLFGVGRLVAGVCDLKAVRVCLGLPHYISSYLEFLCGMFY